MKHERLRARIIRLAAGELSGWEAWWLRRHLARCPDCQAEWEATRQLARDLATLSPFPGVNSAPLWPDAPAQPRSHPERKGITMNYRTVIVACLTLLFIGSAAVGMRQWFNRPYSTSFGSKDHWEIAGWFRGRVRVSDTKGWKMMDDPWLGNDERAPLIVKYRRKNAPNWPPTRPLSEQPYDFIRKLEGFGKHEIRDEQNRLVGIVEMSPWTKEEQARVDTELAEEIASREDFLRSPDRWADCWSRNAAERDESDIGIFASRSVETGIGWKLFGYAKVKATCYKDGKRYVYTGSSRPPLTPEQEQRYQEMLQTAPEHLLPLARREHLDRVRALLPKPGIEPVIHWSVSGDAFVPNSGRATMDPPQPGYAVQPVPARGGYLVTADGRWKSLRQSGLVRGYGRHEIKDASGAVLLTLEVSRLDNPQGK